MKTKTKAPKNEVQHPQFPVHRIVKTIKGKKGTWAIWESESANTKQYWTRLTSKNGKVICSNFGFNTKASALKNIKAVQASA